MTPAGRSLVARTSANDIAGTAKPPGTSTTEVLPETTAAAIASINSRKLSEDAIATTP